ncbi:MAG: glycosyl transferase family 2, partial [Bacteroidota bacterium]|nr:glycosyl transferase family 2 [Bacteroidota bacterium]
YKQVHNSGIARINLYKRHPKSLNLVHTVPAAFVLYTIFALIMLATGCWWFIALTAIYLLAILLDAARQNSSLHVGWLAVQAVVVQHFAYGLGFLKAAWQRLVLGKGEFTAYERNFYK